MEREEMAKGRMVACGSVGGKPVMVYGSSVENEAPFLQTPAFSVAASASKEAILEGISEGKDLMELLKAISSDTYGVVYQRADASYRIFRKVDSTINVWSYPPFEGAFRVLFPQDQDPSVLKAYRPLPEVLETLWKDASPLFSTMAANLDGGVRTFTD